MATPAAKAATLLREAADALDVLPVVYRRMGTLTGGPVLSAQQMRNEAIYIEKVAAAASEAVEAAS